MLKTLVCFFFTRSAARTVTGQGWGDALLSRRTESLDVPPAPLNTVLCLVFGDVSRERHKPGARKDWRVPAGVFEQHGLRQGLV